MQNKEPAILAKESSNGRPLVLRPQQPPA
jgi:hypothetical protein